MFRNHYTQVTKEPRESTLTLKPMGRVLLESKIEDISYCVNKVSLFANFVVFVDFVDAA